MSLTLYVKKRLFLWLCRGINRQMIRHGSTRGERQQFWRDLIKHLSSDERLGGV